MEHQFYIDRLSAFFDNELKNEELVIVKEHIDSCQECQLRLADLAKLEKLITDKSELSENDYWEQSAQKIESAIGMKNETTVTPIKKSKSSSLWWKLTGLAASLAIVALFTLEQKDTIDDFQVHDKMNTTIENENKIIDSVEKVNNIETEIVGDKTIGRLEEESDVVREEITTEIESNRPVAVNLSNQKLREPSQKSKATSSQNVATKEKLEQSISVKPFADEVSPQVGSNNFQTEANTQSASTATLRSSSKATKLNYWRRKVEENNKLLFSQNKQAVKYLNPKNNTASKSLTSPKTVDTKFVYKQLFEAFYNIALLTNDSTEEHNSIEFLETHAQNIEKKYSTDALYYLELYKIDKNKQNQKKE